MKCGARGEKTKMTPQTSTVQQRKHLIKKKKKLPNKTIELHAVCALAQGATVTGPRRRNRNGGFWPRMRPGGGAGGASRGGAPAL